MTFYLPPASEWFSLPAPHSGALLGGHFSNEKNLTRSRVISQRRIGRRARITKTWGLGI
jgi:hypothetical protein